MSLRKRERRGGSKKTLEIIKQCPTCKSIDVVDDTRNGNMVCRGCGRVIDVHSLASNKNEDHGRGSSSDHPLLGSMNLTTQFENTFQGRQLRRTAGKGNEEVRNRKLKNSFTQIDAFCQKMNLHKKYVSQAKSLYKDLHDKGLLRQKKLRIYAACIFAACKMEGKPRSLKEVSIATNVPRKEIGRSFDFIKGKLELWSKLNTMESMSNPAQLVLPYCQYLNLSKQTTSKVEEACRIASEKKLFIGKRPDTIACCILYLVTQETENEKVTPEKISEVADNSSKYIRSLYKKEFLPLKSVLMPKE